MAASAVSVSQAGYNTTMDILGSGTPAVVVPYGEGREDEQAARAHRLAGLGALRVLDSDRLSGHTFAEAVSDALDWTPLPVPLALDGRTRTSELLRTLMPAVEATP
jgi:predicted glycosyltransferase